MTAISLSNLYLLLVICLLGSAFFSGSETALMAINRYRMANQARQGHRAALLTQKLLAQTDRLLSVILLGNTLLNTCAATVATIITHRQFEGNDTALGIATLLVSFALLIVSEATPKVLAASYPQPVSYIASFPLSILLKLLAPVTAIINLFVHGLLKLMRVRQDNGDNTALNNEELRQIVLESAHRLNSHHRKILLNLFELEHYTVEDIMTPRARIEMLDLDASPAQIRRQLQKTRHSRLPVHTGREDNPVGILHMRKLVGLDFENLGPEQIHPLLREPYFIPVSTPILTQLQHFRQQQRHMALVVDEYGELQGIVSLKDILETIIGDFTVGTQPPESALLPQNIMLDGAVPLREINRLYHCHFALDGPRTLNGLLLEHFESIPDAPVCLRLAGEKLEILQTEDRNIKVVRLIRGETAKNASARLKNNQ